MASTGLSISTRFVNKPKQKNGSYSKFSLELIGARSVDKNPHIFLNKANQHIREINRHFYGTLNHFCPIAFAANQEQNEYYTFREVLFQPDKSDKF